MVFLPFSPFDVTPSFLMTYHKFWYQYEGFAWLFFLFVKNSTQFSLLMLYCCRQKVPERLQLQTIPGQPKGCQPFRHSTVWR